MALGLLLLPRLLNADSGESLRTEVTPAGSAVQIESRIEVPAPNEVCYAVLADFDHLSEFIPDMQSSRVVSAPGEPIRLRQVGRAVAGFFTFAFDVTLAVSVDPPRQITFSRLEGNLRQMHGRWHISGAEAGCRIEYQAVIEPAFWVPPLIGPVLMRRQIEAQIDGLVSEINRRAESRSPVDLPPAP